MMVDVPRGTVPGTYKGQVEVRAKGKAPQLLNLEIVVQNQLLPYPKDWKYRLDLWQNPWAVAWYNHVEPWSPEAAFEALCRCGWYLHHDLWSTFSLVR